MKSLDKEVLIALINSPMFGVFIVLAFIAYVAGPSLQAIPQVPGKLDQLISISKELKNCDQLKYKTALYVGE